MLRRAIITIKLDSSTELLSCEAQRLQHRCGTCICTATMCTSETGNVRDRQMMLDLSGYEILLAAQFQTAPARSSFLHKAADSARLLVDLNQYNKNHADMFVCQFKG